MKHRSLILLVLTVIAHTARAGTLDVSGLLGGGYSRSDGWDADRVHTDSGYTWDGQGSLTLSGTPFRAGLMDWLLSADYRDQRTVYDDEGSRTRVVGGRGALSLFGGSVLPISLSAARTWTDFTSDTDALRTGGNTITSLGATAVLQPKRLPSLRATLGRSDMESRLPGGETTSADSTRLTLGASQTLGVHDYALEYATGWDHGSFVQNNYRTHDFLLRYSGGTTEDAVARLTERYYLRVPTVDDRMNPRLDDNNLGAGVSWRVAREGQASLDYSYRHLVVGTEQTTTVEQLAHRLAQRLFFPASRSLGAQANLELGYGLARRDGEQRRSASQAAGAGLTWRRAGRTLALTASADGSFGLVAPEEGELTLSYAAGGGAGITVAGKRRSAHLTYAASYRRGGVDLTGWTLSQRLELGVDAALSATLLRASLALAAARREDELLGPSGTRSATLTLTGAWRRGSLQLVGGVADSAATLESGAGAADLLFLPSEYNAHTYHATLTATRVFLDGRLLTSVVLRTLHVVAPDRPEQWEHGAGLSISYVIGLLTFTADDRLSIGGNDQTSRTANVLYLRLTRTFGGRVL